MKDNKASLITIILLLVLSLPFTIIGIVSHNMEKKKESNPNHLQFFDGHLWFYNKDDELLSKYECLRETCEISKTNIDDDIYNINYYSGDVSETKVYADSFVFITDGDEYNLFDVKTGKVLQKYLVVKNYKTELPNNMFLIENTNYKYGVITVNEMLGNILPFEYDFIAIPNNFKDNQLDTSKFIVLKNNEWGIVDNTNKELVSGINYPIIYFNNDYIFTKKNNEVHIYNYEKEEYLDDLGIKNIIFHNGLIALVTNEQVLVYNNLSNGALNTYPIYTSNPVIEFKDNNDLLDIYIDGQLTDSIAIH